MKALKAGQTITVRAKNGTCLPMFSWKPGAYRCAIGKKSLASTVVARLINRRIVEPVQRGWYSEGHFRFNTDLRDERGWFKRAVGVSTHKETGATNI